MSEPPPKILKLIGLIVLFLLLLLLGRLFFVSPRKVAEAEAPEKQSQSYNYYESALRPVASLLRPEKVIVGEWKSIGTRVITAYSSSVDECDDTPFITASGDRVRDGIVATNEFPFGTLLLIDGEVYEVRDRTHGRYSYLVDIWKPSKGAAYEWGKQVLEVKILN